MISVAPPSRRVFRGPLYLEVRKGFAKKDRHLVARLLGDSRFSNIFGIPNTTSIPTPAMMIMGLLRIERGESVRVRN